MPINITYRDRLVSLPFHSAALGTPSSCPFCSFYCTLRHHRPSSAWSWLHPMLQWLALWKCREQHGNYRNCWDARSPNGSSSKWSDEKLRAGRGLKKPSLNPCSPFLLRTLTVSNQNEGWNLRELPRSRTTERWKVVNM